jgi:hypothetical protein
VRHDSKQEMNVAYGRYDLRVGASLCQADGGLQPATDVSACMNHTRQVDGQRSYAATVSSARDDRCQVTTLEL